MRGTHRVIVQNKRMRYDFAVRRNLTIIRGDSATGKTTLIEMIREYYENGASSGVQLYCDNSAVRQADAGLIQISDRCADGRMYCFY